MGGDPPWPCTTNAENTCDARFMQEISAHHGARVAMARHAANAADLQVQVLAREIVAEQTAEIRRLQGWWAAWIGGEMPPLDGARWRVATPEQTEAGGVDAGLRALLTHHV